MTLHLVDLVVLIFYFDLVPPFYFLKWNRCFSACVKLPNSSCHFWKHKSVFLQFLHQYSVSSNVTPLYFFSSNIIYFGQKQPITLQICEIFECLGQNLLNSSSQFWADKSIPFQILDHSSMSLHITSLCVLSSCIFYFRWKHPIKVPILTLFFALVKICQIPHVIFQTTNQLFFKFCITLQCHEV